MRKSECSGLFITWRPGLEIKWAIDSQRVRVCEWHITGFSFGEKIPAELDETCPGFIHLRRLTSTADLVIPDI